MYTARAVLHEPPRRILAPLPFSPVSISDYLFPGEGPADSLTSLADLLDLGALMEGDIQVTTNAVPLTTNAMPWARMCNRNRAFFFLCVTGLLGSCSRSERPAGIGKCFGNDRNQHKTTCSPKRKQFARHIAFGPHCPASSYFVLFSSSHRSFSIIIAISCSLYYFPLICPEAEIILLMKVILFTKYFNWLGSSNSNEFLQKIHVRPVELFSFFPLSDLWFIVPLKLYLQIIEYS